MKTYYTRMRCIQKTVIVSCIMYISSVLYSDDTRKFLIYGGEKKGKAAEKRRWGVKSENNGQHKLQHVNIEVG